MKKITIRTEFYIKLFIIILFIIFTIVVNNNYLYGPYHKYIQYGKRQDIAILGGSNAMYGISAKLLSNSRKNYNIKNYSISSEGRNFSLYIKWVSFYLKESPVIIYSSIDFWTLSKNSGELDFDFENQYLPVKPLLIDLYTYIKLKIFSEKKLRRKFDNFGDLSNDSFICSKNIDVFDIEKLKGGLSDSKINNFISRIKIIKSIFNSDKVFLRIPPLYINREDQDIFNKYIKNINYILNKNNIEIMTPHPLLYYNNRLACNASHHPTSELREILTMDLLKQLTITYK